MYSVCLGKPILSIELDASVNVGYYPSPNVDTKNRHIVAKDPNASFIDKISCTFQADMILRYTTLRGAEPTHVLLGFHAGGFVFNDMGN